MLYRVKIDDDNCLAFLQQGESDAYRYIIKIYYPPLLHFAMQIIANDMPSAEDILFETFSKIWQRASDFENINHLKNFLYVSVRNACNNHLRKKQRERAREEGWAYLSSHCEFPDEDKLFEEIVHAELMAEIRKAIESLSPQMRRIFIMSYVHQMSNHEISKELNLSYQTVRNQKSKSLALIRKMLHPKTMNFFVFIALLKEYLEGK